jgi:DNA-binding CsgD family transcriptional regulator
VAYRLQVRFRQRWLLAYTFYLASWAALVLLMFVQYKLIGSFLPASAWEQLFAATRPLLAVAFGVALYFLASFVAQMTGGRLSRAYTIAFIGIWGALSVGVSLGGLVARDRLPRVLSVVVSLAVFALRAGFMYGWIGKGLLAIRRIEDPLERTGLRRFVLFLLGGFLAYDLAVRNVTALVGVDTPDAVIGLVTVGANYPSLMWLRRFLHHRALARPADPLPADLKSDLVALGLSARESDVVELLLLGLSHKEIGARLFISPDTVKKHTYSAHRKLGVQNRVQLSYFIQNRLARR